MPPVPVFPAGPGGFFVTGSSAVRPVNPSRSLVIGLVCTAPPVSSASTAPSHEKDHGRGNDRDAQRQQRGAGREHQRVDDRPLHSS
jgi:hypothetical protein